MNLINHTSLAASYTTMHDKAGSETLVVVVKATYRLPLAGEAAELMEQQVPIVLADTATGEPGTSAPEYECDFCLHKPMVDILLLGSAYAPKGIVLTKVPVALRVGVMTKMFYVVGRRNWTSHMLGAMLTMNKPEAFTQQTVSYDIAYGGVETGPKHDKDRAAYGLNPIGCGYWPHSRFADGKPLSQTEALNAPVTSPDGKYQPMSFGPIGRNWAQRVRYAGTYDAKWEEEVFPFLPSDFDARYFQSAPEDQQLPELVGGELVILVNLTHPALTPSGRLEFQLPALDMSINLNAKKGSSERIAARADTLVIEPDKQRFTVLWRVVKDLQNDPFRYKSIEIGTRPKGHVIKIPLEILTGELPSQRRAAPQEDV